MVEAASASSSASDVTALAVGKTPVQFLSEACSRLALPAPDYQLVRSDAGRAASMQFAFRCTVYGSNGGVYETLGEGRNKKLAKHIAAYHVLKKVIERGHCAEWRVPGQNKHESYTWLNALMPDLAEEMASCSVAATPAEGEPPSASGTGGNEPISRLNLKCQKLKLPMPQYDCDETPGRVPNEKIFKVTVCVGTKQTRIGEGRTKKQAKKLAAESMLVHIVQVEKKMEEGEEAEWRQFITGTADNVDPAVRAEVGDNVVDSELEEQLAAAAMQHCHTAGDATATANRAAHSQKAKAPDMESIVERLGDFNEANTPGPMGVQLLADLCQCDPSYGGEPEYLPIQSVPGVPQLSKQKQHQCLVQLSCSPVAVSFGTGCTELDAKYSAAHNAIIYVRLMRKLGTGQQHKAVAKARKGSDVITMGETANGQ